MSVHWKYVAPNVVTSVGIAVGMASIASAAGGNIPVAAWLVIVAVLIDKIDGTLARLLHASSRFGEQMDSFSDLITFGVAPAAFFVAWADGQITAGAVDPLFRVIAYSCAILYVIAAALRLAKFNLFGVYFGREYFFGIPTTFCGALLASGYLTLIKYSGPAILVYFMPVAFAGLALLMVSNVPLPKLRSRKNPVLNGFQLVNVILVYAVGFTWFLLPYEFRYPEYLLACAVGYMVAGITYGQVKRIQPPALAPPAAEESGAAGEAPAADRDGSAHGEGGGDEDDPAAAPAG